MSAVKVMPGWVHFEGMTWPRSGQMLDETEWALRYGEPTREQLLHAASVLGAYQQMVRDPMTKRQQVVRVLREVEEE